MASRQGSLWAEAVFHVLAHVDVGAVAVAASCFDRGWIAWSEHALGPARARMLGEDAAALARVLASHDALAAAQALAWVWEEPGRVERAAARDLAALADADVDDPFALRAALAAGPGVEILRAAAELELPALAAARRARSQHARAALVELGRALAPLASVAPALADVEVAIIASLPRRGRVLGRTIFVGEPGTAGAEAEHAAWQAAHEATVLEIEARDERLDFAGVERAAIALLASRAGVGGLHDAHARWLASVDASALGSIADEAHRAE